jgi:hypothetical protein
MRILRDFSWWNFRWGKLKAGALTPTPWFSPKKITGQVGEEPGQSVKGENGI